MSLVSHRTVRSLELTKDSFLALCAHLEDMFDFDNATKNKTGVEYTLNHRINRLSWADGGNIKLQNISEDLYKIEFSITSHRTTVIMSMLAILFFLVTLRPTQSMLEQLLVPSGFALLIISLNKIAFSLFTRRMDAAINSFRMTTLNFSEEQKEWISNPNVCSACGHNQIENVEQCPNCGISL